MVAFAKSSTGCDGVKGLRIRSACGAGALFVTTVFSMVLAADQTPAAGPGQGRGATQAPPPAGAGGRGAAPVGTLGGGRPTVHTRATLPEWDGFYVRNNQDGATQWLWGIAQSSTMRSLLTLR